MRQADPREFWAPAANPSMVHTLGRRAIHLITRLVFAFAASYLILLLSGRTYTATNQVALFYGLGLFITQFLNGKFIDLATRPDSRGQPPGRIVSKVIAFLGIALRSVPHAIFITWALYMFGFADVFPHTGLLVLYEIGLPLASIRKLKVGPITIIPGTTYLKIERTSHLYQRIAESVPFTDWLETLKMVRTQTSLGVRDSLFLMNLIAHDCRVRKQNPPEG